MGDLLNVLRSDYLPIPVILDEVGGTTRNRGADYRETACHRLIYHQAPRIAVCWEDKCVCQSVVAGQAIALHETLQLNDSRMNRRCLRRKLAPGWSIANDNQPNLFSNSRKELAVSSK